MKRIGLIITLACLVTLGIIFYSSGCSDDETPSDPTTTWTNTNTSVPQGWESSTTTTLTTGTTDTSGGTTFTGGDSTTTTQTGTSTTTGSTDSTTSSSSSSSSSSAPPTDPPDAPVVSIVDSGGWINKALNDSGVSFTIQGEINATYTITPTNCTIVEGETGTLTSSSINLHLQAIVDGPVSIEVILTNIIGNSPPGSDSSEADITPPDAPVVTIHDDGDIDDGFINIVENNAGIPFDITGEDGTSYDIVSYDRYEPSFTDQTHEYNCYCNCTLPMTGTLTGGSISHTLTAAGTYNNSNRFVEIAVTLTDEAGNVSPEGFDRSYADLSAPVLSDIRFMDGDDDIVSLDERNDGMVVQYSFSDLGLHSGYLPLTIETTHSTTFTFDDGNGDTFVFNGGDNTRAITTDATGTLEINHVSITDRVGNVTTTAYTDTTEVILANDNNMLEIATAGYVGHFNEMEHLGGAQMFLVYYEDTMIKCAMTTDGGLNWTFHDVRNVVPTSTNSLGLTEDAGIFYVTYFDYSDSRSLKFTKSSDSGANWSTPVKIHNGDSSNWYGVSSDVAVNGLNVYVIYKKYGTSANHLLFAYSTDGGSSFTSAIVPGGSSGSGDDPRIIVDGTELHVTYHDYSSNNILYLFRPDGGSTWNPAKTVTNTSHGSSTKQNLDMKLDSDDDIVYISYYDQSNDDYVVSQSDDAGVNWSTAIADSSGAPLKTYAGYTSLYLVEGASSASNALYLSYYKTHTHADPIYSNSGVTWFSKSTDNGSSWTTPVRVDWDVWSGIYTQIAVDGMNVYITHFLFNTNPMIADLRLARSFDSGASW